MGKSLPQLYERWAEECLNGPVPEETRAPCLECVMLSHSASDRKSDLDIFFSANTKCCSYMPDLPRTVNMMRWIYPKNSTIYYRSSMDVSRAKVLHSIEPSNRR